MQFTPEQLKQLRTNPEAMKIATEASRMERILLLRKCIEENDTKKYTEVLYEIFVRELAAIAIEAPDIYYKLLITLQADVMLVINACDVVNKEIDKPDDLC